MSVINRKTFTKNFTSKVNDKPLISADKTAAILNRNIVSGKPCRPPRRKTRVAI